MKKSISVILCVAMLLSVIVLAGCGKKNQEEPQGNAVGGWTAATEFAAPTMPDYAKEVFEKATGELDGATYDAVAYLGSQIVAGTNYAFLCNVTTVTAEPATALKVVKIYADLEGNVEITNVSDVDITAFTETKEIGFEQLDGGWGCAEAVGGKLDADVQTAFDKAMDGMEGVSYEPVALLGSQVVAGSNYAILCKATSVTAEPVSAMAVAIVYADLNGGAEVTSICPFAF